ncbi:MAG: phytanoyl-CoA dioxygenase family protein [Planctomycetota bacterium]
MATMHTNDMHPNDMHTSDIDTNDMRARFDRDGFALVPRVLDAEQVATLRSFWEDVFVDEPGLDPQCAGARSNIYVQYPEIRWLLAHPPIVAALSSLLGDDFVYLHECAVHDNGMARWHKDTSSQEKRGHHFHLDPDYRIVQCALYLQANGPWGGGVDVNPGSHRAPDHYVEPSRARDMPPLEPFTVPNEAGDLVVFHTRLNHQATQPRSLPLPSEHRKLAMFILAGPDDVQVDRYHDWIGSREDYTYFHAPIDEGLLGFVRDHGLRYGPRGSAMSAPTGA